MPNTPQPAPEWHTTQWFNTDTPLTLESLRGNVVVLHAFQMLCPGCVLHGIPQAQRLAETFAGAPVKIIGLHTVFEHHQVMGPEALKVFLFEYRVRFPVGIDAPGDAGDPMPRTMKAYGFRGTPSIALIDAAGMLRAKYFGMPDDLTVGSAVGALVTEMEGSLPGLSPRPRREKAGAPSGNA